MDSVIKSGEVFKLADLVPYKNGEVVKKVMAQNDKMKFVVIAFDEGTELKEHPAPGEALIFALCGKAVIGYESETHTIKEGENFKFNAGGKHFVKADGKFKMALVVSLD